MRRSPIHDLLELRGAVFEERAGFLVPQRFSSYDEEYQAVRGAVGLTDFSFTTRFRLPEEGLDLFERYAAGSVANIRFGRVLHTMATDEDGHLEADLYIANDDEDLILIGESLIDKDSTAAVLEGLGSSEAELVDISSETALFGVDGYKAWAVIKDLLGVDILGLPYLSLETYDLDGDEVKLIRGGKTSEFGYLLQVPATSAVRVWEKLEQVGLPHGMKPVGLGAHQGLRLDGRFFNIHAEGAAVKDPLPLGLQWMVDFEGDDFRGKTAILSRRASGVEQKIVGVVPGDAEGTLEAGDKLFHGADVVANVIVAGNSLALGRRIGLALFDRRFAYAGLSYRGKSGEEIRTVSMPPFTARSLGVKLDEL